MNNLFFDLDGTIINSEIGIMKSLHYMYEHTLGYIPHDDATLHTFIGPLLVLHFKNMITSKLMIQSSIKVYWLFVNITKMKAGKSSRFMMASMIC